MLKKEKDQIYSYPSVLIVGFGIVGKLLKKKFFWADVYDKYSSDEELKRVNKKRYDFCFICVPTPKNDDGSADLQYVHDVFETVDANIFCIKSTIPPKTTENLISEYSKKIVFSPEYNGNTVQNGDDYNFVIIGGNPEWTSKVAGLFQYVMKASATIVQTDSRTAELVKYMENSFLATKVVFCNEFYRMAKILGVNYGNLRELFCLDPRVGKSHTFVFEDYPFYDSKCFNKDLPALVKAMENYGFDAKFIKSVINRNEDFKIDLPHK